MTTVFRPTTEFDLTRIAAPVSADWARVEALLADQFRSPPPWLDRLLADRTLLGGKRMRPLLLLLAGASEGPLQGDHHRLAVAIELIHLATLVHDDLIDGAEVRRRTPTVNHQFGAANSVLLGDWLYAQAFVVAAQAHSNQAVRTLAQSIRSVCEGEIRQQYHQGEFDISLSDYVQIVEGKTAALCAAACRIGVSLSGGSDERCHILAEYGRHLGIAFQIVDDILDLAGTPHEMGKTLRTDLVNRRVTAPIIFALQSQHAFSRQRLLQLLSFSDFNMEEAIQIIEACGALQSSWDLANAHARQAQQLAATIAAPHIASSLDQLAEFVVTRSH